MMGPRAANDDLVQIVTELTEEIERFDSVLSAERRRLRSKDCDVGAVSGRIGSSGATILERARDALAELRTESGLEPLPR